MRRILTFTLLAALALASCKKDGYDYTGGGTDDETGTLSLAGFALEMTEQTDKIDSRAGDASVGNYLIDIYDSEGTRCYHSTYEAMEQSIKLRAGSYTLKASSSSELPDAAFETPVYGASQEFTITAGQATELGGLTCRLLQCKVSVAYNQDFLDMVTGDCTTTVELTRGAPLEYAMSLDSETGKPSFDKRNGFFAVNAGTTLEVTFKGMIEGKSQRMSKGIDNVKAAQWRQITFVKKIDQDGNAAFDIEIADYVEDEELGEDIGGNEEILGEDPNAPKGDGGIKLICDAGPDAAQIEAWNAKGDDDPDDNINLTTKPAIAIKDLTQLRFHADVPGRVKDFTVRITSSNDAFGEAVTGLLEQCEVKGVLNLIKDIDVIGQMQGIGIPFPSGDEVQGRTTVDFNLDKALEALNVTAFDGVHTFEMFVRDEQDKCTNTIRLVLNSQK